MRVRKHPGSPSRHHVNFINQVDLKDSQDPRHQRGNSSIHQLVHQLVSKSMTCVQLTAWSLFEVNFVKRFCKVLFDLCNIFFIKKLNLLLFFTVLSSKNVSSNEKRRFQEFFCFIVFYTRYL